ncbi:MAG: hypothetical protein J5803_05870, partial [Desulfovibrio sp.]|nr:hypothetical protein [Desulfovibrio sp.]
MPRDDYEENYQKGFGKGFIEGKLLALRNITTSLLRFGFSFESIQSFLEISCAEIIEVLDIRIDKKIASDDDILRLHEKKQFKGKPFEKNRKDITERLYAGFSLSDIQRKLQITQEEILALIAVEDTECLKEKRHQTVNNYPNFLNFYTL